MADVSTEHAVRIAFRTDVGSAIGLGYLSRCLALAHALRAVEVETLVLLDGDDRALDLALTAGLQASAVACGDDRRATVEYFGRLGVSALIVDSYAFSSDDLRALVAAGRPVIVFDDTADTRRRAEMSQRGRDLVDGRGAARLARAVVDLLPPRR